MKLVKKRRVLVTCNHQRSAKTQIQALHSISSLNHGRTMLLRFWG